MGEVTTIDPSTGLELCRYPVMSAVTVDAAVGAAARAGDQWREVSIGERMEGLRAVACVMARRRDSLAELATAEMGKPIAEARAEVDKCVWCLELVADTAPGVLAEVPILGEGLDACLVREPLGLVLAVMPWNYPYWQVVRATGAALAAGNAVLVKHADNVTGCSLAMADVVREAGLPEGVFTPLVVEVSQIGELIADPRVAAVTLTGSARAGQAVAAAAGAALKPTVLELGGSDPFIVLEDADVEAAADCVVRSRFQNSGQACIAAKRAIVIDEVYDDFKQLVLDRVSTLRVGNPRDEETHVGPVARDDLRRQLHDQVSRSIEAGARLLVGGRPMDGPGFFYAATVVEEIPSTSPAAVEELFGPVLALFRVPDEECAVAVANATEFGLGSNVWTSDVRRGGAVARRLRAGHTAINGMSASDPRIPFGGVKSSGYGRELGRAGLEAFVSIHAVTVHEGTIRGRPAH